MHALLVVLVLLLASCSSKSSGRVVRVAAAADLSRAFPELAKEFQSKTGIEVELTFGSSGLLSKQIAQGAPFTMFAAANKEFVTKVIEAGRCDAATARLYGRGRIVVWTARGASAPTKLEDLLEPRFRRIALANPEHAPYGVAGKQALEKLGIWAKLESRIVLAENVQATMLYARDGNADAAIVALSLAVVSDGGAYLPIDPNWHTPLDQQLVVCGKGREAEDAKQFADFVGSKEGREVMTRYGFVLPVDQ
ncbi:MAG: molybdate ABC transporter substrate-binding protein [Myxococcota bacterium]|nr:molybdate ABC transporter substrate-binding protein [Myxococcota bacterium]